MELTDSSSKFESNVPEDADGLKGKPEVLPAETSRASEESLQSATSIFRTVLPGSQGEEAFQKMYNRIVPFVIIIPVFFLIVFIAVSMIQLRDINARIEEGNSQTVKDMISRIPGKDTLSEAYKQFLALAVLEEESLGERYRQGHYSLVSRSFKQYLGFFTGIIMVIVGSLFVLLKLREKIDSSASRGEGWKFTLVTNSPGVVFGILGAALISIASSAKDTITVRDSGLYLTREFLVAPFFSGKASQADLNQYMLNQPKSEGQEQDGGNAGTQHPPADQHKNEENAKSREDLMIQHPPNNK
ncbi:MAG TPA: hypothetical protein VFW07_03370 [Parafilimonas sp.]|nr:hypothetical protein [Parafilimonas sp.]